jgi:hypothetical protein
LTEETHVTDQTSTGGEGVRERASELAGTAREETQGVVDDARHEASAVVSEAGTQARNILDEAVSSVRHQADDGTGRAAQALGGVGTRLQALARGDVEQAGDLGRYADDLGNRLTSAAQRLGDGGIDRLVGDVQQFGRRRPGVFLAAAALTGFAAGRLLRGAKADGESSNGSSDSDRALSQTSAPPPAHLAPGPDPTAIPAGGSAAEVGGVGAIPAGGSAAEVGGTGGVAAPTPPPASPVPPYGAPAGEPDTFRGGPV